MVVQCDSFNLSRLQTVVCVALTSNLRWADAPGNVLFTARQTGLGRSCVANVSQIVTLDRSLLDQQAGRLSQAKLDVVLGGIELVIGRQ